MLAVGARQRVGCRCRGFSKTAPSGRVARRAVAPMRLDQRSAPGAARARRGAVVQQQRAVGLRRQRGGTMGGGAGRNSRPAACHAQNGAALPKPSNWLNSPPKLPGRLVLARYQFVQPGAASKVRLCARYR